MLKENVTRGHGVLEGLLSKQRIKITNNLIPGTHRRGRILDIGCGNYPLFLATTQFSAKYGLDKMVRPELAHRFRKRKITLLNFDSHRDERLPFKNDYFDVVTMLAVFEHIEMARLRVLLTEIRRILKPGGVYILTTPAAWADSLLKVMASLRLVSPEEIEDHKDLYSHGKIEALLAEAGFAREHMRFGYFELFMNLWATARK